MMVWFNETKEKGKTKKRRMDVCRLSEVAIPFFISVHSPNHSNANANRSQEN